MHQGISVARFAIAINVSSACPAYITSIIGLHRVNGVINGEGNDPTDNKVHGANMGATWGRQDPCGPHVGHMKIAIWDVAYSALIH